MKNRLTVLFGEVADRERRHLSERVSGHLGDSGNEASGISGARVLGRKFSLGFHGPTDFRVWLSRNCTRAKVLSGVLGPADFRARSRRSRT